MAVLLDLPAEILFDVASYLNEAALFNTSVACRRLQQTLKPELYRQYVNTSQCSTRSLKKFLKRIIMDPKLATYVRWVRLIMKDVIEKIEPGEYYLFTGTAMNIGMITKIIRWKDDSSTQTKLSSACDTCKEISESDLSLNDDHNSRDALFCNSLRNGKRKPLVLLPLSLLPNILHLGLFGDPFGDIHLPWEFISRRFLALQSFTAFKTLGGRVCASEVTDFMDVLRETSIHTLRLSSVWFDSAVGQPPKTWNLSNVTHLVLAKCSFSKHGLAVFMNACSPLKTFFLSVRNEGYLDLSGIFELLIPHRNSLEDFYLHFADESEYQYKDIQENGLSWLRDFSRLIKFETTTRTWSGCFHLYDPWHLDFDNVTEDLATLENYLPPSLQHLVLRIQWARTYERGRVLHSVSESPQKRFILRRHITVTHPDHLSGDTKARTGDIRVSATGFVLKLISENQNRLQCPSALEKLSHEFGGESTRVYHSKLGLVRKDMYILERYEPPRRPWPR